MHIATLVLPVFAVILAGWLAGALGYLPRALAEAVIKFAYTVAMPALIFQTIAEQSIGALLNWRFLAAFGGGTSLCFVAVFLAARFRRGGGLGDSAVFAASAAMTNTGFVALPILQALYGARGVLMAAVATLFIAVVLFPALIGLLELEGERRTGHVGVIGLARQVLINPVMLSTLVGLGWSLAGLPLPPPLAAVTGLLGGALTPCALFAVGLGLSIADMRAGLGETAVLTAIKLTVTPLVVYGLCLLFRLNAFETVAAVVCAAVPTAKTAYVLAGAYRVESSVAASTISLTTVLSVPTLLLWLYALV